MTLVSKRLVDDKVQKRIEEIFISSILKLKNDKEAALFLEEFLSPTEKIVLSKRMATAVLLFKGYDYDAICEILKVTPGTISKVSVWMKYKGKMIQKIVDQILKDKKWQEFWNEAEKLLSKFYIYQKGADWGKRREQVERIYRSKIKPF